MKLVRHVALVALLALWILPAASALPLEARIEGATLVVELGEGIPRAAMVVVTHQEDRAWVDRVVRVDKNEAPNATLRIDGLPRDVPFSVRVLDTDRPLPMLASAPSYLDATATAALPSVTETSVAAIPADAGGYVLPVFTSGAPDVYVRDVRVTRDGTIALVYLWPQGIDPHGGPQLMRLATRFSRDGGKSWSDPVPLAGASTSEPQMRSSLDGEDKLVVMWRQSRFVDDPNDNQPGYLSYDPWTISRIDPTTGAILRTSALRVRGFDLEFFDGDLIAGAGSTTILAWKGALQSLDAQGRGTRQVDLSGVQILRIGADATTEELAPVPQAASGAIRAASSPGGTIAVIGNWAGPAAADSMRGWVAVSKNGPDHWISAHNVTVGAVPALDHYVYLGAVAVADDGTVDAVYHALLSGGSTFQAYHVHVAANGQDVTSRDLRTQAPGSAANEAQTAAGIARSGGLVWLSWSSGTQRWLQGSVDGGLTWKRALTLRNAQEPFHFDAFGNEHIDVLPDGRPVIQGGGNTQGTAFPYEPLVPAGSPLNRITFGSARTEEGPARGRVEVISTSPHALFLGANDEARLEVTLHNAGELPTSVALVMSGSGASLVFEPANVDLAPRETLMLTGTVRLADSSRPGGSERAHLLAKPDHDDGGRSDDIIVRWDGPATRAPPAIATPTIATEPPIASPLRPTGPIAPPVQTTPGTITTPGATIALSLGIVAFAALGTRRRRPP